MRMGLNPELAANFPRDFVNVSANESVRACDPGVLGRKRPRRLQSMILRCALVSNISRW